MRTLSKPGAKRTAAFFDLDRTLIGFPSMFPFLEFYLTRSLGEPRPVYERSAERLRAAAAVLPRHEANRRYHRLFAGESAAGRAWWEEEQSRRDVFVPEVLAELQGHRAAGRRIVLVSGQFFACLDPIAATVGADLAIGTVPVTARGRLTGEVRQPLIGPAKAEAVQAEAERERLHLPGSHAYGDHASDLPMLQQVGSPVVVGTDRTLTDHAALSGWRVLSPRPLAGRAR
jgi:HAD superfamily hydrolase (TIGR01490 family)